MTKLIANSFDTTNKVYVECECSMEIMCVEKLQSDEFVIGCITNNGDGEEFLFNDVEQFTEFKDCCVNVINGYPYGKYVKNDDFELVVDKYEGDDDLYFITMKDNDELNECCWEVCIKKEKFMELIDDMNLLIVGEHV